MRVAALLCLALAAPSCGFAAAGGKGGAKKKKPAAGGGGFGATANKEPKLDAKAAKILKQVGGNVDAAQEQHFQSALRRLEKKDPELFTVLMEAEGGLLVRADFFGDSVQSVELLPECCLLDDLES